VTSLIFTVLVRALAPLLLLFAVFLLLTGHHHPGGGFTGGLVAASAFVLHAAATGPAAARRAVRVPLQTLMGVGLLLAVTSGLLPVLRGEPFLTSVWLKVRAGPLGDLEVGSPLLFDLGVFFVVMGVALAFVLSLAEE
jgi:multicomponent Na+:H+ antiporter subunit B